MTKDENFFVRNSMSTILSQLADFPFVTVTVKDFCFGYQDGVIKALAAMSKLANKPVPFDKFGLFIKVNKIKIKNEIIHLSYGLRFSNAIPIDF